MRLRNWSIFGSLTLGILGLGLAIKSFLPQRLSNESPAVHKDRLKSVVTDLSAPSPNGGSTVQTLQRAGLGDAIHSAPTDDAGARHMKPLLPAIDISFLLCGSTTIPMCIAVRGTSPFTPCAIAYSAVLIRHPKATFLYDTGLCRNVSSYLADQPLLFRKTLANFRFDQSLADHLRLLQLHPSDISFAFLSHLHWDHVSGIPDIPGVPLRVNRVEYDAAQLTLFNANHGLVRRFLCDNPIECFDYADAGRDTSGPYLGFRSSYDLFGDGSIVLVPLPGHTAGNTGMFIHRSNGLPLFLLGDAAWVSLNYLRPATMHPLVWRPVTSDDATARQTLIELHNFSHGYPDIPMIAMHDATMQAHFMAQEQTRRTAIQ